MGKKYDLLVEEVNALFSQYRTKMTLRQIYYRLVAKLIIPNNIQQYKGLSRILVKAREKGEVDYRQIEDRARQVLGRGDYGRRDLDLKGFCKQYESAFRNSWSYFRLDRWSNQPNRVEVWVEKDALSRICSEVAEGVRVVTCPSKGYSSFSYIMEAVNRIRHNYGDKEVTILYLGDFDPSGLDITRDLQDRLWRYGANVTVERIALNQDQIEEYRLPPMMAKSSDPRLAKFIADTGGTDAVELDALEPPILTKLIDEGLNDYIDWDLWTERTELEGKYRQKLKDAFETLDIDWDLEEE